MRASRSALAPYRSTSPWRLRRNWNWHNRRRGDTATLVAADRNVSIRVRPLVPTARSVGATESHGGSTSASPLAHSSRQELAGPMVQSHRTDYDCQHDNQRWQHLTTRKAAVTVSHFSVD